MFSAVGEFSDIPDDRFFRTFSNRREHEKQRQPQSIGNIHHNEDHHLELQHGFPQKSGFHPEA
jgi:hypothetical protein